MLLSDLQESKLIKAFVMGEPGTGKTVFGCSMPGPIKAYDFDGKIASAYTYLKKHNPEKLKEIDFESCVPKDFLGSGYRKMDESLEKIIHNYKKTGQLEYKSLLIDSSTVMGSEMMNWLLEFESGIKRTAGIKTKKIASQQDYMIYSQVFTSFLHEILDLPWNVVMTGHIEVKQDEKTGELRRVAAIPGRMGGQIGVYFPEVYRSHVVNGQYVAQTKADIYYACRSQLSNPPSPVKLDYNELIKYAL